MHELYSDLLSLLREMTSHYQQLLDLSRREREALTGASLPTLLAISTQKETLILELSLLEEGRHVLLRKLGEHHRVPSAELTLGRLSTLAPQAVADEFQRCRTELVALVQQISQVNDRTMLLLSSSLDCIHTSLGLLSRLLGPAPIYGSDGHLDTTDPGGKVVHRCI